MPTSQTVPSATLPDVDDLSLDQQIGQMLFLGWGGPDSLAHVNAQADTCVRDLHAGGMILMGRNVQATAAKGDAPPSIDAAAVRAMVEDLQSRAHVPLLVATDQEGGRVARFGSAPFTRMPSALAIGERGDTVLAREAARVTGRELAAVGLNMDFAPVADVNSNPANPVIGDRAFGTTPDAVTPFVLAQVAGYEDGGVLACVKHFPGHGDTALDSHYALPTLPFSLGEMQARELAPFQAAIVAGVSAVMTAHILFPALDNSGLPATLSRPILTGLLREQLGFDGLIVTDCLEMKAVSESWGTARAAVLAAIAGADMLLICHTEARQREAFAALQAAVQTGELPRARVRESARRVLQAKARAMDFGAAPALSVIGSDAHKAVLAAFGEPARPSAAPTTLGAEAPL